MLGLVNGAATGSSAAVLSLNQAIHPPSRGVLPLQESASYNLDIVCHLRSSPKGRWDRLPWRSRASGNDFVPALYFNYAIALYFMISCPGMSENFTPWLIELLAKKNI